MARTQEIEAFWDFVFENINTDPSKLRLKYHGASLSFDVNLAITQIECRRKFSKKLSATLSVFPQWLFPTVLSGEQATSDSIASFHASLIDRDQRIADLTAGLGIDAWHLGEKGSSLIAVEIDKNKAEALAYNLNCFSNIRIENVDCNEYIRGCDKGVFDTVFVDPARRADDGSRVFALSQCQPDVIAMLPALRRVTSQLIVKMSPMLDISIVINQLPYIHRFISVGTPTECKELLAICDLHTVSDKPQIEAVTILSNDNIRRLTFTEEDERNAAAELSFSIPSKEGYLYEPSPAVMKAAPYGLLAKRYGVNPLHPNTHLYYSDVRVDDFPGEILEIEEIMPYASKNIKGFKKRYPKINVATRNFDMSAESLSSKLGIKNGGDKRLFGVTVADGSRLMIVAH